MSLSIATIIDQFRAAMAENGLPCSADIVPNSHKMERFDVDGDPRKSRNGWYILHTDGIPAGAFGCWKRNITVTWCAKSERTLTPEEREQLARQREENERLRKEEQARIWAEAAAKAEAIWNEAKVCKYHPYLERKGIQPHGARIGRWTREDDDGRVWLDIPDALLIPIKSGKKITSLQAIFPSEDNPLGRDKDYLSGGEKRGKFFGIANRNNDRSVVVVCEGFATGASIHEATGYTVAVAFDAGNLQPVAEVIRKSFPDAEIILAADNDRWTQKPYPNPGVRKASEAADAVGGRVVVPDFKSLDGKPTDFNDLHQREGLETVATFIRGQSSPELVTASPAVIVPENIGAMEKGMANHFRVLGMCAERRVWIRDERTGELRAFKEAELARKVTLLTLAPIETWTLAIGAYMGPETKFTADTGFSLLMEIAKAKPRYIVPYAKPQDAPEHLTGMHGADSAIIANMMRGTTLYDEYSCNWYEWETIWRKISEDDMRRRIVAMLDAAFNMQWKDADLRGTFNVVKIRLGKPPQLNADQSAGFDNWNRDSHLLPMRNGVLNLNTSELMPHAPELMMSWMIPHDYDPKADCPRIRQFLFTLAQEDEPTYNVLLCFLAAVLHGRADLQRYMECVGMAGTGKSTFSHICEALVGPDNIMVTSMEQLHQNRFETAGLYGKRLTIINDADKYGGSVDVFKAITGQDKIRYEEKNKQIGKPFIYGGMVLVAANQPIQFTDSSTAMVRRRIPIHIDRKLDASQVDPKLKSRIADEMPGLINLLMTISNDTVTRVLRDNDGLRKRAEMRAMCETNSIAAWLDERCVAEDVTSRIGTMKMPADEYLYSNYALFCDETGRRGTLSLQSFTRSVLDVLNYSGVKAEKRVTRYGKAIHGIRLRTPGDDGDPGVLTGEPIVATR